MVKRYILTLVPISTNMGSDKIMVTGYVAAAQKQKTDTIKDVCAFWFAGSYANRDLVNPHLPVGALSIS